MKGKEIPHSLEAESCLLASMVMDNLCIPKILAKTTEDSFFIDSYRLFFRGIKKTYVERKAVDLVLLKDTMDRADMEAAGGVDKAMDIMEGLPNAANWEAYLKTVKEKEELRRYLKTGEAMVAGIYRGDLPLDRAKTDLTRCLFGEGAVTNGLGEDIGAAGRVAIDTLTRYRTGGVDLKTGWREIDADLGGLRRKELTVFGAKMSNCKTTVAINILCHSILSNEKTKVLINAFENVDQVSTRMAAIMSGQPLEWFVKPHLCSQEQYEVAANALEILDEFKDRVVVMNSASLMDMRSVCDAFKPDLIILDYLQKYGQRYCSGKDGLYAHEIGKVASDVQDLAKDFNAHSILLSQLARRLQGDRNRPPEVPDLKESGDIENVADNILLGWWPWRDQPEGGKDPSDYYIFEGKNKMGPCEKRIVKIDVRTLSITDYGV